MLLKFTQWLLFLLLILSVLAGSCSKTSGGLESGGVNYPDIVTDNNGGAYTIYQTQSISFWGNINNEYYLQRIDKSGFRLWSDKGVFLGSGSGKQGGRILRVFSDNENNVIAIWPKDSRQSTHVTKVSANGELLWEKTLTGVKSPDAILEDGLGGFILTRNNLEIQKIDSEGNLIWNKQLDSERSHAISGDGLGGAFILSKNSNRETGSEIYVQRIGVDGNDLWAEIFSRSIYSTSNQISQAVIISDNTGGAVIVWAEGNLLNAMRIKDGVVLWQKSDLLSHLFREGAELNALNDGKGNIFVYWKNDAWSISGTKISLNGQLLWPEEKSWSQDHDIYSIKAVANGGGGLFLAWVILKGAKERFIKTIIIDSDGNLLYPQNEGFEIASDKLMNHFFFNASSDGEGGVLFAWGSSENFYSIENSSVQRINSRGERVWGDSGIQLSER